MGRLSRRALLLGSGVAIGAAGTAYLARERIPAGTPYPAPAPSGADTVLNDASLLNPTPVASHLVMRDDPQQALVDALRSEIAAAREAGRPVSASAARHSMGGQSLPANGTAISPRPAAGG